MILSAQVDLYGADGPFVASVAKEYTVRVDVEKCVVEFWPEVAAKALGLAMAPAMVPPRASIQPTNSA